jgi:putative peptidoglycan lipid II flippase
MAVLPSMSEQAIKGDINGLKETFSFSLRLVFFLSIPAMAGLIALSYPIINLLYQRGEFTSAATHGTVQALFYYSLGLWAFVGSKVVRAPFYSMQDTKTPLKVALISVITNILFSFLLIGPLKHGGLALSLSIASAVNFVALFYLLKIKLGGIDGKNIMKSFAKISLSSAVMGIIGWVIIRGDVWKESGKILEKSGNLFSVIVLCIIIYLLLMRLMGSDELDYLIKMRKRKKES